MAIPKYLTEKDFILLIDKLILDDGYTTYAKVDDLSKETLTVMAISALKGDAYNAIIDVPDFEGTLSDLTTYIMNGGIDEAVNLAETLKNNAIQHFDEHFDELFQERFDELECERKREAGLKPVIDHVNGEVRWSR